MEEKIVKVSMDIILNSGDARAKCFEALHKLAMTDFAGAQSDIKDARNMINKAHQVHTEYLQDVIQEEHNEFAVLFTHAQDTLFTTNTEINLSEKLLEVFEVYDRRIKNLEKQVEGWVK